MSEQVEWLEFYEPYHAEDYEDWQPTPPIRHVGNVIDCVRVWGDTMLVVACSDGKVRQVKIDRVKLSVFGNPGNGRAERQQASSEKEP